MWIIAAAAIFFIWQWATGAAFTNKMWKMVKDQITDDQSRIIEIKNEQEKWYEEEIAKRDAQIEQIKKEKAAITARDAESRARIIQLEGKVKDLEDQIANITVSSDPDGVVKSLQRRFPSIKRK